MRSITEESDGSTNGVNCPLRAKPSQATISTTMENTRAKPHSRVCASDGAGASSVWSGDHGVCSRHCSIRFMSIW